MIVMWIQHMKVIAGVLEELKNESQMKIWISYVYCIFLKKCRGITSTQIITKENAEHTYAQHIFR